MQNELIRGRALIIGGSIAGLFAALLLRRIGWEAQIFERSTGELAARGAGIVTHADLRRALELSGAPEDPIGVEIGERVLLDREGVPIRRMRMPQTVTSWAYLYDLLRRALPDECYRTGHALTEIESSAGRVGAIFSNRNRASGDILVAADGISSTVRALMLPEAKPAYAGYVAWRGLLRESELSPDTHRVLANRFSLYLPPGEEILGYPVAGPEHSLRAGSRYYNFVWYRPVDELELPALLTDQSGQQHSISLPPDAINTASVMKLRDDAERSLPPPFAEVVGRAPFPFIQAIYELRSLRLVFGRVAMIGDAACLARPHVGTGVTKAAGDAIALAEALGGESGRLEEALAGFESQRLEYGKRVFESSRHLGQLIRAGASSGIPLDSIYEQVLALTAVAPEA